MNVVDLLAALEARGVALEVDGATVRWRAPQGAMTVELVREVKANKPAIVSLLTNRTTNLAPFDLAALWWNDHVPEHTAPPTLIPPRRCLAPVACSRLGCCERHQSGQPCLTTEGATDVD